MKYSADKVLLETTRSFYHFLYKTPSMNIIRAIMVLSGSYEFWKKFNNVITERESDEMEVRPLMKETKVNEPKKEAPFYLPWSIKARTLLHAHLSRLPLGSSRLEEDQRYYLTRIVSLCEEFIRMHLQMHFYIQLQRPPTIETMETLMKLPSMFVQALWLQNSPLLQLPHLDDQIVNVMRRKRMFNCIDLANINEFRRRKLLQSLDESQYEDVITVLQQMPRLGIETEVEVSGEDDKHTITAGAIVTLKVTLKRHALLDSAKRQKEIEEGPPNVEVEKEVENEPKRKVWEKPQKKKKGGKKNKQKKKPGKSGEEQSQQNGENVNPTSPKVKKEKDEDGENNSGSESDSEGSDIDSEEASIINEDQLEATSNQESSDEDDDLWNDGMARKEALLEKEPTDNHLVHAPYYPLDKYEWWYLYMIEKKSKRMATLPISCKTLKDVKTVGL